MRVHSYLNSAENILSLYDGKMPFASWLKQFFAQHKKYGSKDRKYIAHLCYCFFRLGHSLRHHDVETRLKIGLFFCSLGPNLLLEGVNEEWNKMASATLLEKAKEVGEESFLKDVFPFQNSLSREIDSEMFAASLLVQPDLFLRIRPGNEERVKASLLQNEICYSISTDRCLSFPNSVGVDKVLEIDKEAVIQDLNSQKVLESVGSFIPAHKAIKVWDCCAASGGKSILIKDTFNAVRLSVSDVRKSILHNLLNRFLRAGIDQYHSFVADVSNPSWVHRQAYDLILCDAPCTGSGTWSRNPEQLYFFSEEKIKDYSKLQKSIAKNVSRFLKPDGYLLYITCSVFREENETVVEYLQKNTPLKLLNTNYYKGYTLKADTLFVALFSVL